MRIGNRSIGWLYVGRCFTAFRDCEVSIGLWRRRDPPEGEYAFRFNFTITWDWPRVWWSFIRD